MVDPTDRALQFIQATADAVIGVKPEATPYEIVGAIYLILNRTIETQLNANEPPKISETESGQGTPGEPEQVQGTRSQGRVSESTEGIRQEPRSLTKSGAKKHRSAKG